ncbi:MAG TPA: HemK/PrmC family methyltransferase, partial [Tepidisphaeraceae bacterium]|nr:HemK/PrmC family methyltransferase [Tepidisphaeraceae bacterium]
MADGGTWTVRRILEWTSGFFSRKDVDPARLSAELLLAHVLDVPRIKLYTDYERPLTDRQLAQMRALVQRAAEQEPIAYLTGNAHFFNLEFIVTRDVLIPRPDTETLVENVLQLCRHQAGLEMPRVLDLCTGSGCIAIAVARNLKNAVVVATEISPPAASVARKNAERLGVADRVIIEEGSLFEPIARLVDP